MDQLARLPGEPEWEKENAATERDGKRKRKRDRDRQRERERERMWRRKRVYHKAILQYYVRTSAQWLLALVGVVSLDVPVRCTNRTKGRTLWVPSWLCIRGNVENGPYRNDRLSIGAGREENVPRESIELDNRIYRSSIYSLIGFARSRPNWNTHSQMNLLSSVHEWLGDLSRSTFK